MEGKVRKLKLGRRAQGEARGWTERILEFKRRGWGGGGGKMLRTPNSSEWETVGRERPGEEDLRFVLAERGKVPKKKGYFRGRIERQQMFGHKPLGSCSYLG